MPQFKNLDRSVPLEVHTSDHMRRCSEIIAAARNAADDATFNAYFSNAAWDEKNGSTVDISAIELAEFVAHAVLEAIVTSFVGKSVRYRGGYWEDARDA